MNAAPPAAATPFVYFTWPDGGLQYDCRPCLACCQGLGIGLDAIDGQQERILARHPALTCFLRPRGAASTAFNPRGGCWFLTGAGMCRLEAEQGRADKPAACRLFPFNRIFRLGAWTVVDYNSVICPLQPVSVPSGPDAALSGAAPVVERHATLWAEIAAVADPALVATPLPLQPHEGDGTAIVAGEQAIADACQAERRRPDPDFRRLPDARPDSARKAQDAAAAAVQTVFDQPIGQPSPALLRSALLLWPSLRFNAQFGPHVGEDRADWAAHLPAMAVVWLHGLAQGEQLADRPLDLRDATTLWSDILPLAAWLARWQQTPVLAPGPLPLPAVPVWREPVRAFAERCVANRRQRRPLGELIAPLLAGRPPAQRVLALRHCEGLWAHIRWQTHGR